MQKHHPGCPEHVAIKIAKKVAGRPWWSKTPIGKAVGKTLHNFIRHELTDYESLFRIKGLTREEAHIIIQPDILDVLNSWKEPQIANGHGAPDCTVDGKE